MDKESKTLLDNLFTESIANHTVVKAKKFRAENHKFLDVLDSLVNNQYIEEIDGN